MRVCESTPLFGGPQIIKEDHHLWSFSASISLTAIVPLSRLCLLSLLLSISFCSSRPHFITPFNRFLSVGPPSLWVIPLDNYSFSLMISQDGISPSLVFWSSWIPRDGTSLYRLNCSLVNGTVSPAIGSFHSCIDPFSLSLGQGFSSPQGLQVTLFASKPSF